MNNQDKFILLSRMKEDMVSRLREINEELEPLMKEMGDGTMFQDSETGLVYKIQKAKGQYVTFKEFEYVRTKKESEDRGTLSKTEAEKAGFKL